MKNTYKINNNKLLEIVLFIILIMVIILFVIVVRNPGTITELQRQAILEEYGITDDRDVIIYNQNNKETLDELNGLLNSMPDKYLNIIKENEWKIIFVDEIKEIDVEDFSSSDDAECYGLAKPFYRLIYLVDMDDVELLKMNMLHELGHAIDYTLQYSASYSLLDLYAKYKEIGYTGYNESVELQYAIYSEQEFFATTFKDFIMYPYNLGLEHMDIYNYYQGIVYGRTVWK